MQTFIEKLRTENQIIEALVKAQAKVNEHAQRVDIVLQLVFSQEETISILKDGFSVRAVKTMEPQTFTPKEAVDIQANCFYAGVSTEQVDAVVWFMRLKTALEDRLKAYQIGLI